MTTKYALLLLTLVIALSSCFKEEYNFQDISLQDYNPTLAAPIVNTTLVLEDVLQNVDSGLISTDSSNLLQITYSDSLLSYSVLELVNIPDQTVSQEFNLTPVSIDNVTNSKNITLGQVANNLSDPERTAILSADGNTSPIPAVPAQNAGSYPLNAFTEFNTVTFSSGSMNITITNNWSFAISNVIIELRNTGDNSLLGTFTFPFIAANSSNTQTANLANKTMSNNLEANMVNFESPGSGGTPVPIDLNDALVIDVATNNLTVVSGTAIFPSQEVINQSIDVDVALDNGEDLRTLRLSGGTIDYTINYGIREDAVLTLNMPYVTSGGTALTEVININSDNINPTVVSGSIDLSGYEMDLTAGGSATNNIQTSIAASIVSSGAVVPFDTSDAVTADLSISNLSFTFIDGYLGSYSVNIDPDSVDLSFMQNELTANINLANPQLRLHIDNSIGIPVAADLSGISSYSQSGNIPLTGLANPTIINAPAYGDFSGSEYTLINIDAASTNIEDILNSSPDGLIYGMGITVNPDGDNGNLNFVTDQSKIDVSMDATIPIYASMGGFIIRDTLEFPQDVFEQIKSAILRTNIDNEFPVDVQVQMYFTDASYSVIDSLFTGYENIVSSSSIDAQGELVAPSFKQTDFVFDEEKVENVRNAEHIIITARLATTNDGGQYAKFYSHYQMHIKLGIQTTVQFNFKL